jgi:radical SAM protein with 4Fe4S-binding SPASM domain
MRIGNMRTGELDPAKQQAIGSVINNRAFLRPARELDFESCSQCDIAQVCMAACPADSCSETGALQPELRCSAVVYTFQSVFARVVREELWPLILSDPVARDLVAERVGARPPDSLPA